MIVYLCRYYTKRLTRARIEEVASSIEIIFRGTMKMRFEEWRDRVYWRRRLSRAMVRRIMRRMEMRETHLPLQYILGRCSFGEIWLKVRRPVFIPRPETPHLVTIVQGLIENLERNETQRLNFIEVGVGSGALSCLLLHREKGLKGTGCDINSKCIDLARENLTRVVGKDWEKLFSLTHSDFKQMCPAPESLDFLLSNPPYIPLTDEKNMARQILSYESRLALFSDNNGIQDALDILSHFYPSLKLGGFIAMELSPELLIRFQEIREQGGLEGYELESTHKDYFGLDRFIVFRKTKEEEEGIE